MPASKKPLKTKNCSFCKSEYLSNNIRRMYCSNRCNAAASYDNRKKDPTLLEKARNRSKNYYHKHKKLNPRRFANAKLINRYGITIVQYEEMAKKQRFKCAICNKKLKLIVDHCHDTSKVRSLLCNGCNRGIGYFKENPKAMRNAAKYIERWSK